MCGCKETEGEREVMRVKTIWLGIGPAQQLSPVFLPPPR